MKGFELPSGIQLRMIIDHAGPNAVATGVVVTDSDRYTVEVPLEASYASDEDISKYLAEFNSDLERFGYHCFATDEDSVCYDMKNYTPAAWDRAVENVRRDYEQIVLMPLVGAKIGLALMFEDLIKQRAVKKYRVRTGESIKLD